MLPHVVAHQDPLPVHQGRILVGPRRQGELAVAGHRDEDPAGAELPLACRVEIGLELLESAEIPVDGRLQLPRGLAAGAAHDLPEHGVIGMAPAVVAHGRANRLRDLAQVRQHVLERHLGRLGVLVQGRVEIVDIGRMVLAMVDLHGLGIDMRFVLGRRVRQGVELEGAGWGLRPSAGNGSAGGQQGCTCQKMSTAEHGTSVGLERIVNGDVLGRDLVPAHKRIVNQMDTRLQ